MGQRRKRARIGLALIAVIVTGAVLALMVTPEQGSGQPGTVTVMTRNLYLGGDITRPLRATEDRTGQDAVLALGLANHELRAVVDRTDFPTRSQLLADEIAAARPDLLGLQEVALWRHGPLQLDRLGRADATEVDYDFLPTLLADVSERGVDYDVVQVQQESDVEAPAFPQNPSTAADSGRDVRLTVRDVLLVRSGSGIRIVDSGAGQYDTRLDIEVGGVGFTFVRGFGWADVEVGPVRLRFITTHLESQSADLALAQAGELLTGPAAPGTLPTVIVCDCNADPADTAVRAGDSVPPSAAYELITGAGFADQWRALEPPPQQEKGFTAALSELVNDATPAALNRRLDLVLARNAPSGRVTPNRGEVTGDELTDRSPQTGLWPSDHAGVVVRLRIG